VRRMMDKTDYMEALDLADVLTRMAGRTLIQFCVGAGMRRDLQGSPYYEITIECPLFLDGSPPFEPTDDAVVLGVRDLLMQNVGSISVDGGTLTVAIGEHRMVVAPHQDFEAWQINADDGTLVVCMPGGGLSTWFPRCE